MSEALSSSANPIDPRVFYRALKSRDRRFDGRFFVGVKTTGIYCRPICPAPTPKARNITFYRSAAAAAEAGFRPCRRCRPEAAPGTPAWVGTPTTVSRALRLIEHGALDDGTGVDDLAERLGIGSRHLRRLFNEHLGAAPLSVAQTRRLHFAKRLIDSSKLAITDVAFASGFSSIRRFNAAFREAFRQTPSEVRKKRTKSGRPAKSKRQKKSNRTRDDLILHLTYRPPYDVKAIFNYFTLRATPGVEAIIDGTYSRAIRIGDKAGCFRVSFEEESFRIRLACSASLTEVLLQVTDRVRDIFDLAADPMEIDGCLATDRRFRSRIKKHPGLRVPGGASLFEIGVRAILGQQISVAGATTLAGRLAETYGEPIRDENYPELRRFFPEPAALVKVPLEGAGMPRSRAQTLRHWARAMAEGDITADDLIMSADAATKLAQIPGIGPWTAEYIAMRALRMPDAFPASDLGFRRVLGADGDLASAKEVERIAEAWRPWRAYGAMHLWCGT